MDTYFARNVVYYLQTARSHNLEEYFHNHHRQNLKELLHLYMSDISYNLNCQPSTVHFVTLGLNIINFSLLTFFAVLYSRGGKVVIEND